jgi:hypothetical protein
MIEQQLPLNLLRQVRFFPGYDDRATSGGIHGMRVGFALIRPGAWAAVAEFYTRWMPTTVERGWDRVLGEAVDGRLRCSQLSIHFAQRTRPWDYQHSDCRWLGTGAPAMPCWCSGDRGGRGDMVRLLVDEGDEAVWRVLADMGEEADGEIAEVRELDARLTEEFGPRLNDETMEGRW